MTQERHNAILMEILQEKKTISGFLQSIFGFLSTRTDFYFETISNDDTIGFPPGFKEQLVLQTIKQFETKKFESRETISGTTVELITESIHNDIIETNEKSKIDCESKEIEEYNSSDSYNENYFTKSIDNVYEIFQKNKQDIFNNLNEESEINEKFVKSKLKNDINFTHEFTTNDVSHNKRDFSRIPEGYKCQICMKITKNRAAIVAHLSSHLEQSRLCFKCGRYFKDHVKARFHLTVCKDNIKTCDSSISTKLKELNYNEDFLEYDEKIKRTRTCPICLKKFDKFMSTYDHINSHTKAKPYICSCGRKMAFYNNLVKHICKFKCTLKGVTIPKYCNFSYGTKPKETKESPNGCKICNTNFFKNEIKQHFSTEEHLIKENEWIKKYDVKEYICKVCQIDFDNILTLIVHEVEEHKTKINSQFFNKIQNHSKYCKICNKTFTKTIHYFDHMNMHNKILPYKCSCGTRIQHYESFICHFKKMGCSIEGRIFPDYCPKTFQTSLVSTVGET